MKKLLCVLLSLLMIFSCVSVAAAAGEEDVELIDFSAEIAKRLVDDDFAAILGDTSIQNQIAAVTGQMKGNDIDALRQAGRLNNVNLLGLTVKDLYDANTVAWTNSGNAAVTYPSASWTGISATSDAEDLTISARATFTSTVRARVGGIYLSTSQSDLNRSAAFKSLYTSTSSVDLSFKLREYGYTDDALQPNTTYYYRFYIVTDDGDYTSAIYSFTTGTSAFTVAASSMVSGSTPGFRPVDGNVPHAASGSVNVGYYDFALLYGEMNDYLRRMLDAKLNNLQVYTAANATKITNIVGHLFFPDFEDVTITFSKDYVTAGTFYKAIGLYSGLTELMTNAWFQPKMEMAPVTDAAGRYAYTVINQINEYSTMYITTLSLGEGTVVIIGGKTYTVLELKEERNGSYYYSAVDTDGNKIQIVVPGAKIKVGGTLTVDGRVYSVAEQQMSLQQATDFSGNRLYDPKVNFVSFMSMLGVNYREMSAPDAQINRPADVASFLVRGVFENIYTIGPIKYLSQVVQSWLMMHATTCFPATEAIFVNWINAGRITSAQLKTYEGFLNLVANGNDPTATGKLQFIKVPADIMLAAKDDTEFFLYLLLYLNLLGNNKNNPNVVGDTPNSPNSMKNAIKNTSLSLKNETKNNLYSYLDALLLGNYSEFSQKLKTIAQIDISYAEEDARNSILDFLASIIRNFWNFFDKIFRKIDFMHVLIK